MKYRELGRTGLVVSEIAVGCSGWWGDARFPERRAHAVIAAAVERGVNHFDTGHHYCNFNAEPRLGRILSDIVRRHGREKVVVSTKLGSVVPGGNPLAAARRAVHKDFSPAGLEATCRAAVRNLGCGDIDVVYLHGITRPEMTDAMFTALDRMKRGGLFRALGINTHAAADMRFVAAHPGLFDVALVDYSVLQIDREDDLDALHRAGIGVVAGTVLGQGHLIDGKIGRIRATADLWYLARAVLKGSGRAFRRAAAEMRGTLAGIPGLTPAQAAVAYVLGNPAVASCVFGTTRVENLAEIVAAVDTPLPAAARAAIRDAFARMPVRISG
jgi:aryl-alcohol dehydrogenase-like predicted oxidoreductase